MTNVSHIAINICYKHINIFFAMKVKITKLFYISSFTKACKIKNYFLYVSKRALCLTSNVIDPEAV